MRSEATDVVGYPLPRAAESFVVLPSEPPRFIYGK